MTEHQPTPSSDATSSAARLARLARHPAVFIPALLVGAVALFEMGRSIGATVYDAVDGDTTLALTLGAGLLALLMLLAAGIALAQRRSRQDGE